MSPPRATETELAILDVLWNGGPRVVRDITQALYTENNPSSHATVKSLLDRLEEKGLVERDRSGFAHLYRATVTRADFVGSQLQELADSHFEGSLRPLLMQLADRIKLSPKDRSLLRRIVDKPDK